MQNPARPLPGIDRAAVVEPERFGLVERLEVRRVDLTNAVRFARRPDPQRLSLVPHVHQQRQREVVAQDAAIVDAVELDRIDVHRVARDGRRRRGKVHDFGERTIFKVGERAPQRVQDPADGILRQIGQARNH